MVSPQVEHLSNDNAKILFDLCDIEDIGVIDKIPREVLHQNIHTGRVILDETDPMATRLMLLGFKPTRLQWLPGSKS